MLRSMLFLGIALLLLGFFLCISVAWAAIGFLAMGFGLICLLIVEKRKKASTTVFDKNVAQATRIVEARQFPPVMYSDAQQDKLFQNGDRWKSLIETDPDIVGVAKVLSQYGSKYTEQLARVYNVFEDKTLLPIILELIIASARKNVNQNAVNKLELSPSPEIDQDFFHRDVAEDVLAKDPHMSPSQPNKTPHNLAQQPYPPSQLSMPIQTSSQVHGNSRNISPGFSPAMDVDDDWDDLKKLFNSLSMPN
jgi:hypothetical protein